MKGKIFFEYLNRFLIFLHLHSGSNAKIQTLLLKIPICNKYQTDVREITFR